MSNPRFVFPTLPENNWLRQWYEHKVGNVPQCYPEYHFAGGLGYIQHATGRKVYCSVGGRKHYSNLNHLLLGPTTIAHKTDAIMPIREDLTSLGPEEMLSTDFSGAGLLEELELNPCGNLVIDEAGTLLNRLTNNKEAGIIRDILCRVYDNDPSIKKKLKSHGKDNGELCIENAFPLVIIGTTPATFSTYAKTLDMTSGWFPRFLMYNPDHDKPTIPMSFDYIREESDAPLLNKLEKIRKKFITSPTLRFKPDECAITIFTDWQTGGERKYADNNTHGAIFNRLMMMALKMSMNFMIADINNDGALTQMDNTYYITPEYLEPAIRLVDDYFMPHSISVYEMVERDSSKNIQDKIISILTECGGKMEKWRLGKNLHILARERDEHLQSMLEHHEIGFDIVDGTEWVRFYNEGDIDANEYVKIKADRKKMSDKRKIAMIEKADNEIERECSVVGK